MTRLAALALAIAISACSPAGPVDSPDDVIHVVNMSDRAVMVTIGDVFGDQPTTAARPCSGDTSVRISAADYEQDGRLQAMFLVDPTGTFDVALKDYEGDPVDMPGSFSASPIWSDGRLAGRLPIYLTIADDLTVTESVAAEVRASDRCAPAY